MNDDPRNDVEISQLPKEIIDRLKKPFDRFLKIESAGAALLLAFTISALVLANSEFKHILEQFWETEIGIRFGSLDFTRTLREWINDGLMTLFFFIVALELKRELVLGELKNPRMAALSIAGALGGMLVPAVLYLSMQWDKLGMIGWGTVMATDTVFVIACLTILGSRIPQSLRVFMLSLAIIDDIGAILVVAIGYSSNITWEALAVATLGLGIIWGMSLFGIRRIPLYLIVGVLIWLAIDFSGIHATIAGVLLGLMTPARRWINDKRLYAILAKVTSHPDSAQGNDDTKDRETLQLAEIATRESLSPVERLEIDLHPWVSFLILPLFAFANAGFTLAFDDLHTTVILAVVVGFVLGKPVGIFMFSWLAVKIKLALLPSNLSWRLIAGGGILAGIGFTMALFIANLAFSESLVNSAKLAIFIASIISAIAGILFLMWVPADNKSSSDQ